MEKELIIIRGIPGAGKTTLAKRIETFVNLACGIYPPASISLSEDDFWTRPDGSYIFNPATRDYAFSDMAHTATLAMERGYKAVIINTAATELKGAHWDVIFRAAKKHGYDVFPLILQRNTNNPPSIHGVSEAEMNRFRAAMEHGLEVTL